MLISACTREVDPQNGGEDAGPSGTPAITSDSTRATKPDPVAAESAWTIGLSASNRPRQGVATLIAVRTARHEGFERIVFEFKTPQLPNYRVEYVDRPVTACGSGEPVPLKGDAWLQISLEPAYAHDDAGHPTVEDRTLEPKFPNLIELKLICDFEAIVAWAAGLNSPNRYRVLELTAPARIVVDIR